MFKTSLACLLTLMGACAFAQDGLQFSSSPTAGSRLGERNLRFDLGAMRMDLIVAGAGTSQVRARLFGDYYLTGPGFGGAAFVGGLRLTSGVAIVPGISSLVLPATRLEGGLQGFALDAAPGSERPGSRLALPYIGVGYSSVSTREAGWGLSADIGLGGVRPGDNVRFGASSATAAQVESVLNNLRLSPVVQVGVSYAF